MSRTSFRPAWSRRQLLLASAAITGASAVSTGPARALLGTLADRLATIETIVEQKRKEFGVPGAALAIVLDGAVVMTKGFGSRDLAGTMPVTPETQFAIGSDSKAFTAMAAVMSADAGKLSLDDSPKKFLPYFKMQDPEADAKITIRDLLVHNSGLMRTDLTWVSGVLSREEVIRVAGLAKPTQKFREAFQYQNPMYIAAGEAIGAANGSSWESVIESRIFAPLGMKASKTNIAAMRQEKNFAPGHEKVNEKLEPAVIVDRSNVSAAGAITSNVIDMAQWVRFLIEGGVFDGKRLVSQAGFDEMTRKHIFGGVADYGLGFFVGKRGKYKAIWHGGNIDGFESHVFFAPERKLGFVLLTNIAMSGMPNAVRNAIWANLVDVSKVDISTETAEPRTEAGRYATTGVSTDIVFRNDKLFAQFYGQPEYPMVPVSGRRYRFDAPAPDGFFVTFRAAKDGQNELFLEQPQGSLAMTRLKPASTGGGLTPAENELLGSYELGNARVTIEPKGDFAQVLIPGQHPYTLVAQGKDLYGFAELPETFRLAAARGADGKLSGITFKQPQGEFTARRVSAPVDGPEMSVDALMAQVIAAFGGEANLRKNGAMQASIEADLENLGLTGKTTLKASLLPDIKNTTITVFGLGKEIGSIRVACEGAASRSETSFSNGGETGACSSDFDAGGLLNWKTRWDSVTIKGKTKFEGEDAYVVLKSAAKLRETDTISAKTFLVLQRETEAPFMGTMVRVATERFADYREIEGVKVPMRSEVQHILLGRIVSRVADIKFGA